MSVVADISTKSVMVVCRQGLTLTELGCIGARRVTSLVAEDTSANEIAPLDHLCVRWATRRVKGARVHQRSQGVPSLISAMGILFTASVVGLEVESSLINEADGLDVSGCSSTDCRGEAVNVMVKRDVDNLT